MKKIKMLQKTVSQLEQMCLKLGLKNGYTLTISKFQAGSLFHRSGAEQAKV